MPTWLKLAAVIFGFSLVVPLFVLCATGGNWRAALQAWRELGLVWLALAALGIVAAVMLWIFPPSPP